ncbi:oxygen-dependent FAD-linked oxidoreductase family protein [Pleurotus pulmonarius]
MVMQRHHRIDLIILYCMLAVRRPFTRNTMSRGFFATVALFAALALAVNSFQDQANDLRDDEVLIPSDHCRKCKTIPGDESWPSQSQWESLANAVDGNLLRPLPAASPCYFGDVYSKDECARILANWTNSDFHAGHPSSIMFPLYTGLACIPTADPTSGNCTQGTYPVYVVDARKTSDIQHAVNFARNHNIRLVIKNTGHDFAGKSAGLASLSILTHHLKNIAFIDHYNDASTSYTGPALKVSAGAQSRDVYAAARDHGVMVVGGEGETVGFAGGYIQQGGHSPLSSILGMAVDSVLSMEVVLADGTFVTTDANTLPDLFWALRGGGPSTFGVLVSVTVKAHPDIPVALSQFSFDASARDMEALQNGNNSRPDFWAVVRSYFDVAVEHADRGIYGYWNIRTDTAGNINFVMMPLFSPQHGFEAVQELTNPILEKAKEVSIAIDPKTTLFSNFYDAWVAGFPQESIGTCFLQGGSRLFPRSNFVSPSLLDVTFDAIKSEGNNNSVIMGLSVAPTLKAGGYANTSVTPAWRDTIMHIIDAITWSPAIRDLECIDHLRDDFTFRRLEKWRAVTPGSGCYLGETDINEPNFQQAFWGPNYSQLYSIKQKYDPMGVFFAETAVGSEDWTTGPDRTGRLCPI